MRRGGSHEYLIEAAAGVRPVKARHHLKKEQFCNLDYSLAKNISSRYHPLFCERGKLQ
jgi:hypothetical protein